jgi:HEAT repeat protein
MRTRRPGNPRTTGWGAAPISRRRGDRATIRTRVRTRYKDLFERMRDPDPVAADAAFDAVLFDRAGALPDLVECLERSRKDPVMRFLCVQLLGFSGAKAAVAPLIAALDDRDPTVRAEACRSLEDLRAHDALGPLRARLDDIDAEVKLAAAEAILGIEGRVGDES